MSELEVKQHILQALEKMPLIQQIKLLEFINSILAIPQKQEPKGLLQFAGIFDNQDKKEFELALTDCEQINSNEW